MAFQEATHANQVVVVQRAVPRGEVIDAGDLAVVTIGSAPGVSTVPAGDLPGMVGRTALVDLVEIQTDKQEFSELQVQGTVASAPVQTVDGAGWVLDVFLPQSQAQRVADLAAHDRIVLVRKAG